MWRDFVAAVRRKYGMLINNMGISGGYTLGSGNNVTKYVPLENCLIR